ncbi:MAG: hypothetical protein ACI8TX_002437 [Hyphomicrobiaceae bacterium]|jgi:hypothetical protein
MATRNTESKVSRNDPCPCGSGKKHKQCCAIEESVEAAGSFFRIAMLGMGLALVFVTVAVGRELMSAEPVGKRVWSAEHGHWHNVTGDPHGGGGSGGGAAPDGGDYADGEEVDGRVWSEAHGHFHGGGGSAAGSPQPGKVWDPEHGHYHPAAPIERETVRGDHFSDKRAADAERIRKALSETP